MTEDEEALMTAEMTKLGAHPASSLKDLRDKLANLQSKVSEFEPTLNKSPDNACRSDVHARQCLSEFVLLGLILTCMLDQQNRA